MFSTENPEITIIIHNSEWVKDVDFLPFFFFLW